MKQFLSFAGIGVIGTAGHYAALLMLVEIFNISPVYSTTFGFIFGALINYILNYKITFSSEKNHSEALTKFFIIAVIGAAMNTLIMQFGISHSSMNYLIIQIIATIIILFWNFVMSKFWVFIELKK